MSDLKWADVAHYYLQSDIQSDYGGERVFLVECRDGIHLWQYCDESKQDCPLEDIDVLPILRHLEDMTEAEAVECFEYGYQFPFKDSHLNGFYSSCKAWASEKKELMTQVFTHLHFHWLLNRGFDIFGLIESGEAIRKHAEG